MFARGYTAAGIGSSPMDVPALPISLLAVTVQLGISDGACRQAVYGSTSQENGDDLKAKSE